ncbi:MAG: aminotransferase class V-fold PLP-dependent enzyme [Planctomycetota bacterium]
MQNAVYLNHAGTSWPKPPAVHEAVHDAMQSPPLDWAERFERAHVAVAGFFGVRQPEHLLLTPGCTSSLAVALADVDLGQNDRVLISAWEHHALHRPVQKRTDWKAEVLPACKGEPFPLDRLEDSLRRGGVGLVAFTAASNVTGDRAPCREIVELAHRHGAQVLIDAAQVVGWTRLDCESLGAEWIAFGGHKGLQSPWGIGGLYMSPSARMVCTSAECEIGSQGQAKRPSYCDVGSVDQVALAGLHAAVGWLGSLDADEVRRNALTQIGRIESALAALDDVVIFGGKAESRTPTVSFAINGRTSSEVAKRFRDAGVVVGSGLQCSPLGHTHLKTETQGVVRLSVGIGQSHAEVDAALDRITEVARSLS